MPNRLRLAALIALATLLASGDARAVTSWTLSLTANGGDWDEPLFLFTNTSDAGEQVVDLSISVGDPWYRFDAVVGIDPSETVTGATLDAPDRIDDNGWLPGGRSSTVRWSFTDFQPGEALRFAVDIDHVLALFGSEEDARGVLFNNDFWIFVDPNAVVSATFSDGSVASLTLPDGAGSSFLFSSGAGVGGPSAVPEPRVFVLAALGLAGLAWLGAPRRPSTR